MRKIRTTFRPNEVREVTESEYTDLSRQGLVLKGRPAPAPEPVPSAKTSKPRAGADSKES